MIKNSLKYTKIYHNLSKNLKTALEFLENNNLNDFKNGNYEIQGEDIYVNIQDYQTKPQNQGKWEAHRKYIDIQFLIEGSEKIGVGEIQNYTTIEDYNNEKDVEFLSTNTQTEFLTLNKNDFIILYPQDVHMPQICCNKPSYVKKAIFKVKFA